MNCSDTKIIVFLQYTIVCMTPLFGIAGGAAQKQLKASLKLSPPGSHTLFAAQNHSAFPFLVKNCSRQLWYYRGSECTRLTQEFCVRLWIWTAFSHTCGFVINCIKVVTACCCAERESLQARERRKATAAGGAIENATGYGEYFRPVFFRTETRARGKMWYMKNETKIFASMHAWIKSTKYVCACILLYYIHITSARLWCVDLIRAQQPNLCINFTEYTFGGSWAQTTHSLWL